MAGVVLGGRGGHDGRAPAVRRHRSCLRLPAAAAGGAAARRRTGDPTLDRLGDTARAAAVAIDDGSPP
ncbi:hypothetical protein C884_00453 [Kocuria palustris PEL]|uniref:Uncharacterized protein n=1 Tax=Kocuria palustris PEL TaxID=1236550 RepID=M2XBN9_9MICC|nr:hypothetical protein C884_00453 [Kocuria palustris PEL]